MKLNLTKWFNPKASLNLLIIVLVLTPMLASCAAPTSIEDLTGETSYICDKVIKPGWKGTIAMSMALAILGLGFYAIAQFGGSIPLLAPVFGFAQNYWQRVVTVMLGLMIGAPIIMQSFQKINGPSCPGVIGSVFGGG
jgi:hypothetical protein